MGSFASNSLERSPTPSLLDSRFDHDSCGVGFVATLRNQPSHEILTQALTRVRGNKTAAADLLRLKRTTFAAKMKALESRFPVLAA